MISSEKLHTIYAIRCKENGKLYIGRTTKLDERLKVHFSELKSGRHKTKPLLEDYQKYGRDNFEVYVLEKDIPYSERHKEYDYMKKYNSFDKEYGYNTGDKKKKNGFKIDYIYSLPPNKFILSTRQNQKEKETQKKILSEA